ncbi:metal-dependent transcriptional regulator [Gryllotalpicola daejeonensis]|uniref:Manganese transport regulator n=1 Tax=Gryllotalpicola daejeonensis TaxID=993087 RepID=A0ABP7ZP49_9MICO
MPLSELSSTVQDYLKVIWSATEWAPGPVTVTWLAERMKVRKATASDAVRRLVEAGLLAHEPYGGIELTDLGREHALGMVRRHRLIETFLVDTLGYDWSEVHDEAENLEHAVSDTLVDRIDGLLGHPTRDPHGDPIPTSSGLPHLPDAVVLTDAPSGVPLTVERISDADPTMLRELGRRGIRPGATLTKPADLTAEESAAIWVSR